MGDWSVAGDSGRLPGGGGSAHLFQNAHFSNGILWLFHKNIDGMKLLLVVTQSIGMGLNKKFWGGLGGFSWYDR